MKPPAKRTAPRPPAPGRPPAGANHTSPHSIAKRERREAPDELLESVLLALAPIEPAPAARQALQARIMERVRRGEAPVEIHYQNTVTIRAEGGEWRRLAPGVHMKRLHRDGVARSFLLRLSPGAALPVHRHDADEECLVLEGEVFLGELRVAAGDYHLARGGTTHGQIRSPHGALLFIRSASGVPYPL
jgi:anti-sigma factor ChrR (cupin superfamily)